MDSVCSSVSFFYYVQQTNGTRFLFIVFNMFRLLFNKSYFVAVVTQSFRSADDKQISVQIMSNKNILS